MPQVIKTPSGEEMIVLPRAEYERLTAIAAEAEEDAADIAAYDAAKAALASGETHVLPADISAALLRGESLVGAVRKSKGVRQGELARLAGLSQGHLSDIENRRRKGSPEALAAIAKALDAPVEWFA
jgi:DNA-binding transcriptional regulator YiaG